MSESTSPPLIMGLELPDISTWSERAMVVLGQNPSVFAGPGTNTYLIGTGKRRILLDTGHGVPAYLPVLERALEEAGCEALQEIVLTHGHPDHIGGVEQVMARFGEVVVKKHPWPELDGGYPFPMESVSDGDVIETEGASLRAIFTPGHAPDHVCFWLEEDRALISGDNVLGVGTTVIPSESGDLKDYMNSLERMLAEAPDCIYPAHGPLIEDGVAKLREYIDHRNEREIQLQEAMSAGAERVTEIVEVVYAAYPRELHTAAGQSITSHLLKLEREGKVERVGPEPSHWRLL